MAAVRRLFKGEKQHWECHFSVHVHWFTFQHLTKTKEQQHSQSKHTTEAFKHASKLMSHYCTLSIFALFNQYYSLCEKPHNRGTEQLSWRFCITLHHLHELHCSLLRPFLHRKRAQCRKTEDFSGQADWWNKRNTSPQQQVESDAAEDQKRGEITKKETK